MSSAENVHPPSASRSSFGGDLEPAAKKHRVLIALLITATIAYYFWTAVCSFDYPPEIRPRGVRETDHFNLLSHGFLKGHLHLDGAVPQALIDSPNPYDPAVRGNVPVLHDASYFRGKYYIYFGPAPVVTLFAPFTLLTGRDLPLPYAVWLFTSGAFLALTGILISVQRRAFPKASGWSIAAGVLAIGGGSLIVALLRRPNIWELAASAGLFYFALSQLCLVRALFSRHAARWCALGGLALGLAVASRPTYILLSVLFALPLLFRRHRASPDSHYTWRSLFAAAATCTIVVLGLFAYNYARFGNPLEFGQKYQLSSVIEGEVQHFSLSYAAFNLRVYLLSALRWTSTFPFHNGIVVPPFPSGHGGYEYSVGMLTNLPFSLVGLLAFIALALPSFRRAFPPHAVVPFALAATTSALLLGVLVCYFGNCIRYMADFTPWFMLLGALALLHLEAITRRRLLRFTIRAIGLSLALFSTAAAGLAVVNLYNPPLGTPPAPYRPLARALNYAGYALNHARWPDPAPLELTLSFPRDRPHRIETLLALSRGDHLTAEVCVEYLADQRVRFLYREAVDGTVTLLPSAIADSQERHTFRIAIGGAYDGDRFTLRTEFDGRPLGDLRVITLRAFPAQVVVAPAGVSAFSGQIHDTREIAASDFAPLRFGGARISVHLHPSMAGRAFPLVVSGRAEAGDFLFFRVTPEGRVVLGYDHWGAPGIFSPELPARFGQTLTFECWLPAVLATAQPAPVESRVVVLVDGTVAWQHAAAAFETRPETIFVGRNPIGGSACEPLLEHAVIEDTQLPLTTAPKN